MEPYTLVIIWEGEYLVEPVVHESREIAEAAYSTTVDNWRRSDMAEGVTIQLYDGNGSTVAEETFA